MHLHFLFECQCILHESTNWGHYILRLQLEMGPPSEPREGLAWFSAKGVPSFLGYFKTLSIGLAPAIEPATSRSAVNTLYRLS